LASERPALDDYVHVRSGDAPIAGEQKTRRRMLAAPQEPPPSPPVGRLWNETSSNSAQI
jgi:hypothetical protein